MPISSCLLSLLGRPYCHPIVYFKSAMVSIKCYPQSNPDVVWDYCPSFAAAILWIVLFGSTTTSHVVQAFWYRKSFAWVLIMGGLWEVGGYVARTLSTMHQLSSCIYIAQFLLILLAPLWINAFIYMVLGRMIHFFLENDRVFGIRARKITLIFVLFDITAFIVQCAGGSMMSGKQGKSTLDIGLGVYCGGIGLQLLAIFIFMVISARFRQLVQRQTNSLEQSFEDRIEHTAHDIGYNCAPWSKAGSRLLYALWTALGFIIFRNIYRLVEYTLGFDSYIVRHEWFAYVFDAVPMLAAMLTLNILHPGKVLQGSQSGFSEDDKAIKLAKRAQKQKKKDSKAKTRQTRKEAKIEAKQIKKYVKAAN